MQEGSDCNFASRASNSCHGDLVFRGVVNTRVVVCFVLLVCVVGIQSAIILVAPPLIPKILEILLETLVPKKKS